MTARAVALGLLLCAPSPAQEFVGGGDFLTDNEVDVLRAKQGFQERIQAYIKFATLRLELVDQLLAKDEAGRGAKVHRTLQEYGSVIEAIDDVIDDALLRNRKTEGGLAGLLEAERGFLARLAGVAARPEEDAWRFQFVLEDAMAITQDSIELLAEDLGDRKRAAVQQEEAEKRRLDETMAPERRREAERERQAEAAETSKRERKRPSLLRPGERVGDK